MSFFLLGMRGRMILLQRLTRKFIGYVVCQTARMKIAYPLNMV